MVAKSISELDQAIVKCNKCPRLVAWRKDVSITKRKSYENEKYWGKPVPGFGDPDIDRARHRLAKDCSDRG